MKLAPITRAVGRAVLQTKKNSPTVMFVVGIAGVTAAAVLASRATLRLEETLDYNLSNIEDLNELQHSDVEMDEQDIIKDKIVFYGGLVFDVTKLYAPAVIVGGIGIACLTGSHNILMKRNAALTAAYVALERSYTAYRDHIRLQVGEENELVIHRNAEATAMERQDFNEVTSGKKAVSSRAGYSGYAKFFDEASQYWTRNAEKNLFFIHCQQNYANELLHSRGHLFLNEVYDSLGIPRTTAGSVVGWTMYEDGDNYVDFGIFNHHSDEVRSFVNGVEECVLLDFNVDGVIYDKIER
jgi:hypothetical protein